MASGSGCRVTDDDERQKGSAAAPGVEGSLPPPRAEQWLTSEPLTVDVARQSRRHRFLTARVSIACAQSYARGRQPGVTGLVVIGVHSPEFAFEKHVGNVRKSPDLQIGYPVAIDNSYAIWRSRISTGRRTTGCHPIRHHHR